MFSRDPNTNAHRVHESEMTLNGMLMSGTGGSKSNDGEYRVVDDIGIFGCLMDVGVDRGTTVNVAREGNASIPLLASAGNFWKGR
mmetsp:Transcript_15439/g.26360  ORF Transcript_15439/g.26360 Transcript_15439/m.26360 type:complete len:85 (-) Transcript_15439:557-811(-)